MSAVVVEPIGTSTAIKVSFTSPNPQKAARIANAIADAYVEDQLVAKFEATQKATEWLASRISDLSQKAQAADAAVQLYKAQHNITTTANGASVLQQQLADLNNQVIVAKTDLAEKQTSYSHLAALARSGRAANSGQVLASPLIATLRAQEATLQNQAADLQAKYGPRHPKMRDLDAQKANLDSKINEEIQRVVESKQTEVEAAQSRLYSLQSSLQNLEQENAGQNRDSVPLIALQSAAASARAMYEAFLGRLNQTQGQQGIQTPDARIISRAEVSQAPSYPKKGLSIGLSIPAGLLLGLLFAYLAERLDSGFRTASQVETALGLPVLSTVPEVISPDSAVILRAVDLIVDKPTSAFAEAIRGLQLGLALSNVDVPPKVIIVTSAVPSEGKTTLAISLARMAVRSGLKCVVVDGDLRRPNVAKVLEIEKPGRGLVDVLVDHTPVEDCFSKDPRSDVQLLTCGVSPPSPAEVLSSQAMHHLVEKLRQSFDLVIIDSAPILPVNDTKVLSRLADAVLVVVRWEKTPREAATNAVRSLMDVHAPIAGIALARADNERFRYYSYGYQSYYSYDKYYGK